MSGTPTVAPNAAQPHRKHLRAAAGAAALACGVLLVAGCGSSSGSGAASAPSAGATGGNQAPGDPGSAFAAYTQCLKDNGYTLPDRPSGAPSGMGRRSWNPSDRPSGRPSNWPSGRPSNWPSGRPSGMPRGGGFGMGNTADPAYQKAAKACESKRPSFGGGRGGSNGGGGGAAASALKAFADCMKGKGVTVQAAGRDPLAGLSTSDPKVSAALNVCRPLLPSAGSEPAPSASPSA
ncbi:hypothetical protein [Peterkaempfera sp. SMS 1(5)a]|uniref:hypothetical protein n=1 Tax=Peterkaempfera podocarpi TaxID=3232308 RepID=UPI00366F2549